MWKTIIPSAMWKIDYIHSGSTSLFRRAAISCRFGVCIDWQLVQWPTRLPAIAWKVPRSPVYAGGRYLFRCPPRGELDAYGHELESLHIGNANFSRHLKSVARAKRMLAKVA